MIVLHTLGESVIEVGSERVGPAAPHVFGLLLYLGVERGRREGRSVLQALFFPEAAEKNANHNLRQLVYKARQLGAPVETEHGGVRLCPESIRDDYTALIEGIPGAVVEPQRIAGGWVPGYSPSFSAPFATWLEGQRARMHAALRRSLLEVLAGQRRAGDWGAAEAVARACIALDPLNEDATLALAEVLALGGSRLEAVRLLDGYLAEVGSDTKAMQRPAAQLRRRIAERLPMRPYVPEEPTFRGRSAEMAHLQGTLQDVRTSGARSCLVWGDPGIGKTRLLTEFTRLAVLGGATVQTASFQPHDVRRPMAAFSDLVPMLRKLPGAIGCSPEALTFLDRLVKMDTDPGAALSEEVKDAEYLSARITRAISELLDAIAAETTLMLVLEDVHWCDKLSLRVFDDLMLERRDRRLLLVLTSREMTAPPMAERATALRLEPLGEDDAAAVFREQLLRQELTVDGEFLQWCLQIAAGNPYFVRELSRHYAATRETYKVPVTLTELLARRLSLLGPVALKVLQGCAVLGKQATFTRVERILGLGRVDLLNAVQGLEEHGLLTSSGEQIVPGHALLAEVVLKRATTTVRKYLHRHAAEVLAPEIHDEFALGWACAEHWEHAGVPERSVAVLRSCAKHAMEIGRPGEAVEALERALKVEMSVERQVEVTEELIEAAAMQSRWHRLLTLIPTYWELQRALGHECAEFHPSRLLHARALVFSESDATSALPMVDQILDTDTLDPTIRLDAALLAVQFAYSRQEWSRAEKAIRLCAQHVGDSRYRPRALRAMAIYHAWRGDSAVTRAAAHEFASLSHGAEPVTSCRYLWVAGHCLGKVGDTDAALEYLQHGYRICKELGLLSQSLLFVAQITLLHLLDGNTETARTYIAEGNDTLAKMKCFDFAAPHLSNVINLALLDFAPAEALRVLDLSQRECARTLNGRDAVVSQGFRLRIAQLQGIALSQEELALAHATHLEWRSSGDHDEFAEALWYALVAADRRDEADRLLDEYLQVHRADKVKVWPGIRRILNGR